MGTKYNLNDQISVTADYTHIKGDDKFMQYTDGMAYKQEGNTITLLDYDAVTTGVTYKFAPQWRTNLGYGAVFFDNSAAGKNKTLQQGWLNVLYNPVKPITLGAEYVYGERELSKDDHIGRDSRLGFMAKYDF